MRLRLPIYLGIAVTPLLMAVAIGSMGIGHGVGSLPVLLFPYALIVSALADAAFSSGMWIAFPLAAVQFPMYGYLIGLAWSGRRSPWYAIAALVMHVVTLNVLYFIEGGL